MTKKRHTRNFGDVIRAKLAADSSLAERVHEATFNAEIAMKVHALRSEKGLTQKQLADLVETQQSVISRIEDADYDGHSLSTLRKIAIALNRELKIEFWAEPAECNAEVTEFSLDWSVQGEWQATIDALKAAPIDPLWSQIYSAPHHLGSESLPTKLLQRGSMNLVHGI